MESISTTPIKIEGKTHPKSSPPIKIEDETHLKSSSPIKIERKTHLRSSSPFNTSLDPREMEQKNHPEEASPAIEIDTSVKDLQALLPMFLVTVVLFFVAYRNSSGYSFAVLALGVLDMFLLDRLLPIYQSMMPKAKSNRKLCVKSAIWLVSTSLGFVMVFLFSDVWNWSSESTVAADLIVFTVSVFSLYGWMIGDIVSYWKQG